MFPKNPNRRDVLKWGAAAAAAGVLGEATGCTPDTWFNDEKRSDFEEGRKGGELGEQEQRDTSEIQEEKINNSWEDNSRIEVQPFLEEEVRSWDEALEAQKYYRKMERRFKFYGSYGGYDSFDHFLRETPQLKKNSEIFLEVIKGDGDKEGDVIKGAQAPEELRHFIEDRGWVQEQFITAIIAIESNFNVNIKDGADGEVGVMQVKPSTAEEYGEFDLKNPEENIQVGASYYEKQLKNCQNPWLAAVGYNGGAGELEDALGYLSKDSKPIEIITKLEDNQRRVRDYLIKIALVLDYINEQEAHKLASNKAIVGVAIGLRDKYNK